MPSSSWMWVGVIGLWLFVLAPMLISKIPKAKRTPDFALAARVLHRGGRSVSTLSHKETERVARRWRVAKSFVDVSPNRVQDEVQGEEYDDKEHSVESAHYAASAHHGDGPEEVVTHITTSTTVETVEVRETDHAVVMRRMLSTVVEYTDSVDVSDEITFVLDDIGELDCPTEKLEKLDSVAGVEVVDGEVLSGRLVGEEAEAVGEEEVPVVDEEVAAADVDGAGDGDALNLDESDDVVDEFEESSAISEEDEAQDTEEEEVTPSPVKLRQRGVYDGEAAEKAAQLKYRIRQRTVLLLVIAVVVAVVVAVGVTRFAWGFVAAAVVILVLYLINLRIVVREEMRIHQRRMQRARLMAANERAGVGVARERVSSSQYVRHQGRAVVLDVDYEDPVFEHLDYYVAASSASGEYGEDWEHPLRHAAVG